jgi:ubiquinone/menaquinone biosynthesis C-methylase UbiE
MGNKIQWIPSVDNDNATLLELDKKMSSFYATLDGRQSYQAMLNNVNTNDDNSAAKLSKSVAAYIVQKGFSNVLEVGCGAGSFYANLNTLGFNGQYKGVELADYVIEGNKQKFPQVEWSVGSAYSVDATDDLKDLCVSFFVLEHLVFPKKGLGQMMATVKKGGSLLVVFPDFVAYGFIPSQLIGITSQPLKTKIKKLQILDAFFSIVDKYKMKKKLAEVQNKPTSFYINTNPYCLHVACKELSPDVDAVYLANKQELEIWGKNNGYTVNYPLGKEGQFDKQVCIEIIKAVN